MADLEHLTPASVAVTAGRPQRTAGAPVNHPLSLSSTFLSNGERVYLRSGSTTTEAFEEAVGALEGGSAVSFGSGMAALSAVLDGLEIGARVVAPTSMYWGSIDMLRHLQALGRLVVTLVPTTDTAGFIAAAASADLIWLETPSNPLIEIADLPAISAAARASGASVAVDSTMATPILQRPLEHGARIVMHSATKYLSGHSDGLIGVLIADEEQAAVLRAQRTRTGASPGALESFLALRGLRTLDVRVRRQTDNALTLANRLALHPAVTKVRYPGLPEDPGHELAGRIMDGYGAMLAFELATAAAADAVCAGVRLITPATSLGGVESMVERRAKYAGEQSIGTPAGLIRFSVGIEDVDDLWADLSAVLDPLG